MNPRIIIHGGAWDIPLKMHNAHLDGIRSALETGIKELKQSDDPVRTVIEIIKSLEDNPAFDAGTGSFLNDQGQVEMDAGIMDGIDLSVGAVAGIRNIKNPIMAANLVRIKTQHALLIGQSATDFAVQNGLRFTETEDLLIGREREFYRELKAKNGIKIKTFFEKKIPSDTVGAVVMNSKGHIAAGTSTGGTPFKKAGRVGDSPIPGAGFWADNEVAGISTTGWGEGIMRVQLAKEAATRIHLGAGIQQAADESIRYMHQKVSGDGGLIVISRNGDAAYAFNTPYMAVGEADIKSIRYVKIGK